MQSIVCHLVVNKQVEWGLYLGTSYWPAVDPRIGAAPNCILVVILHSLAKGQKQSESEPEGEGYWFVAGPFLSASCKVAALYLCVW